MSTTRLQFTAPAGGTGRSTNAPQASLARSMSPTLIVVGRTGTTSRFTSMICTSALGECQTASWPALRARSVEIVAATSKSGVRADVPGAAAVCGLPVWSSCGSSLMTTTGVSPPGVVPAGVASGGSGTAVTLVSGGPSSPGTMTTGIGSAAGSSSTITTTGSFGSALPGVCVGFGAGVA